MTNNNNKKKTFYNMWVGNKLLHFRSEQLRNNFIVSQFKWWLNSCYFTEKETQIIL